MRWITQHNLASQRDSCFLCSNIKCVNESINCLFTSLCLCWRFDFIMEILFTSIDWTSDESLLRLLHCDGGILSRRKFMTCDRQSRISWSIMMKFHHKEPHRRVSSEMTSFLFQKFNKTFVVVLKGAWEESKWHAVQWSAEARHRRKMWGIS